MIQEHSKVKKKKIVVFSCHFSSDFFTSMRRLLACTIMTLLTDDEFQVKLIKKHKAKRIWYNVIIIHTPNFA